MGPGMTTHRGGERWRSATPGRATAQNWKDKTPGQREISHPRVHARGTRGVANRHLSPPLLGGPK